MIAQLNDFFFQNKFFNRLNGDVLEKEGHGVPSCS